MGTLKVNGHIEGNYIKANWLYTSAATENTSADKIACIGSDNYIYYITPANMSVGNSSTTNNIKLEWNGSVAWDETGWIAAWTSDGSKIKALNKNSFCPASGSDHYIKVYNSYAVGSASGITADTLASQGFAVAMINGATNNPTGAAKWIHCLNMSWNVEDNANWVTQLAFGVENNDGAWYRTNADTATNKPWKRLLDSSNYTSYTVTKTGSGASGTWGISITGNAAGLNFYTIDNNLTVAQAKDQIRTKLTYKGIAAVVLSSSYIAQWNTDTASYYASSVHSIIALNPGYNNTDYGHFLVARYGDGNLCHIGVDRSSWGKLKTILDNNNYTDYTVTKTGSGASGTWGINITGNANSAGYSTYLNTTASNEIRFHNATGLTAGGNLWLGYAWADGNTTVTKDWYIGNFSGGGLANIYASTFNGTLNGTASSANWASGASYSNSSNALASTGWGNSNFTYLQSGDFYGNSGWSHYLISNHGDGSSYYNFVIALPFWSYPKYKRMTVGSESSWYNFHTTENVIIQSSTPGAGFQGQIWFKI